MRTIRDEMEWEDDYHNRWLVSYSADSGDGHGWMFGLDAVHFVGRPGSDQRVEVPLSAMSDDWRIDASVLAEEAFCKEHSIPEYRVRNEAERLIRGAWPLK